MENVSFICPVCEKETSCRKSLYHEDKCCSRECANKLPKNKEKRNSSKRTKIEDMISFVCEYCGKTFYKTKGYVNGQLSHGMTIRFCSKECHNKGQSNKVKVNCSGCGKEMMVIPSKVDSNNEIFCSKECQLKHQNIEIICENCGKKVTTRRSRYLNGQKYCSRKCYGQAISKEYEVYSRLHNSLMRSSLYKTWRLHALQRDNYKCVECGRTDNLHVHHIHPLVYICRKYKFIKNDILESEEFNDLNNAQTLCVDCHIKKHLAIKNIFC